MLGASNRQSLELEPQHDLPVPRVRVVRGIKGRGSSRIDIPETAGRFTERIERARGLWVVVEIGWHAQSQPVEEVEELGANLESHLLTNGENAAEAHVFRDLPLPAIVIVVTRRNS